MPKASLSLPRLPRSPLSRWLDVPTSSTLIVTLFAHLLRPKQHRYSLTRAQRPLQQFKAFNSQRPSIQYPASLALRPLGWSRTTRGASSKPRLEPEHAPNLKLGLKLRLNLNLKLKLNLKPGRGNQNAIENETGAAMPATEREKLCKTILKFHIIG